MYGVVVSKHPDYEIYVLFQIRLMEISYLLYYPALRNDYVYVKSPTIYYSFCRVNVVHCAA